MSNNNDMRGPPDLTVHKASKEMEQILEMEKNLKVMKRSIPTMVEYYNVIAHLRHEKYKALVKEGFSADQALALVMHDGGLA